MANDKKSALESYLRGLATDVSMGYADEAAAGLESAFTDKSYDQALEESRQAYKQAEEDNPKSYAAGEMTGMAGSILLPGGAVKAGIKGARRLALERMAKSGAEAVGRSNGEELGLEDVAGVLSSGIPLSKMKAMPKSSKDIDWRTGRGVKHIKEKLPEGYGKVIQKADPLQEAALTPKGKVTWEGATPQFARDNKRMENLVKDELLQEDMARKLQLAKERVQAKKQLPAVEQRTASLKKELAEGEQSLPLQPSVRRKFFEDISNEIAESEASKAKLLELLKNRK